MDELDTAAALARVEQRFLGGTLSSTYPTAVWLILSSVWVLCIWIEGGIVHKVWYVERFGGWGRVVGHIDGESW